MITDPFNKHIYHQPLLEPCDVTEDQTVKIPCLIEFLFFRGVENTDQNKKEWIY